MSLVVAAIEGRAEGCRPGAGDAITDPGHEEGAQRHQHDGRVRQVRTPGAQDQQDDQHAEDPW